MYGQRIYSKCEKPMALTVSKYQKHIGMAPDTTLKLTFRKLPLVKLLFSIKEEYPQLYGGKKPKPVKIPFSF